MKVLLSILSLYIVSSLSAQRAVDLRVNLQSPVSGNIQDMVPFPMEIEIKNVGTESLLFNDILAVYVIVNGDTMLQMNGNYWSHTNITLAPQQTHIITKNMVFDNSSVDAHLNFCVFVRLFNPEDPSFDPDLSNNKSCAEIDVVDDVASTTEINAESIISFPNPVKNTLYISGENVTDVVIADQAGKIIMKNPANLSQIDCSQLESGIYFVRITTGKGESVRKIVKE